jgi:hypothetical protein
MDQNEQNKTLAQLIAKAWADDNFKKKLLSDPAAVLKAEGVELPAGMEVHAVEDTETMHHLVIPTKPTELSEDDLEKVAGGMLCQCPSPCACICQAPPPPCVMMTAASKST